VLPKGKLDKRIPVFELETFVVGAPAELDQLSLAADSIGRTVENMRTGDTTGELPVDTDVFRIEIVRDTNFAGNRLSAFVDRERGDMGMFVDDAGAQVLAGSVDGHSAGSGEILPDLGDLTGFDEDVCIFQSSFLFIGPDSCVFDQDILLF